MVLVAALVDAVLLRYVAMIVRALELYLMTLRSVEWWASLAGESV